MSYQSAPPRDTPELMSHQNFRTTEALSDFRLQVSREEGRRRVKKRRRALVDVLHVSKVSQERSGVAKAKSIHSGKFPANPDPLGH